MKIKIYPPNKQGIGQFDNGRITEQKPIGFPGEGSEVMRVGPLFYWAWAKAKKAGYIPKHPHQGFEIITYVVSGKAEHGDSLGTKSVVGPGGIQVMQTGSGVWHEEGFVGPNMEGFQIWFEPFLNEAIKREPSYHQYHHEDFPNEEADHYSIKTVIGKNSPVELVADTKMWDISIKNNQKMSKTILPNKTIAILAIRGDGIVQGKEFKHKDFILVTADEEVQSIIGAKDNELRLIMIEVPTQVNYPVYSK